MLRYFDELRYFTQVISIGRARFGYTSFASDTNLEIICFDNIQRIYGSGSNSPLDLQPALYKTPKIKKVYFPNIRQINDAWPLWKDEGFDDICFGNKFEEIAHRQALTYLSNARIIILAPTPPTISSTLNTDGSTGCYIYVPDESYEAYTSLPQLTNWSSKIRKLSTYTWDKFWEDGE